MRQMTKERAVEFLHMAKDRLENDPDSEMLDAIDFAINEFKPKPKIPDMFCPRCGRCAISKCNCWPDEIEAFLNRNKTI